MEPYLYNNKEFKFRNALCRLRTSSHLLEIERGRHSKPKIDLPLRICKYCLKDEIEDEIHFMLGCSLYDDKRFELFNRISEIDPQFLSLEPAEKFVFIMSSNIPMINVLVSKFVFHNLKIRKSHS